MTYQRTGQRAAGRAAPDQDHPSHFTRHAEGSVLVEFGDTRVLCTASVEERRATAQAWFGRGLGHRRIRHAAACHPHPQRPRSGPRQAERPHARDSAPDRALAALRVRSWPARRTHDLARLRCAAGRWRHPAPRPSPVPSWRRTMRCPWLQKRGLLADAAGASANSRFRRRGVGRHRRGPRRCSTSTTPKIRVATPT